MKDATQTDEKKPLKIAILGTAPSSAGDAPFDDPNWEIWGCSSGAQFVPRATRWFEIHDWKRKRRQNPAYWKWATETDIPIYMDVQVPEIKTGVVGWREPIIERFKQFFTTPDYVYVTNSISWMICQAIIEIEANGGDGEIAIYGVDMAVGSLCVGASGSEYAHQRPSCEYWIGWCHGAGIPCYVPDNCDLLKNRDMYGFDTDNNKMYARMVARGEELQSRLNTTAKKLNEADKMAAMAHGALQTIQQLLKATDNNPQKEHIAMALRDLESQSQAAQKELQDLRASKLVIEGAITSFDHVQQGCPVGGSLF